MIVNSNLIAESTNTLCFPKSTSGVTFNDFYFDSVGVEGEEYWFNHGGSIFGMTLHVEERG